MDKPICDFVEKYAKSTAERFHMPGHKGNGPLGIECFDITEIDGADSLYEAKGIIAKSESNASKLFGSDTFYSTEGSSHCIRAAIMLICILAKSNGTRPVIFSPRNAHKSFFGACALLGADITWLYPDNCASYLSCGLTPAQLDKALNNASVKPTAVYITSPDYLGTMSDIKGISEVCKKHSCLLAVDNAHGAYLKFLNPSMHPIDLGADICCDSAHKTLPVITGGAYLHVSNSAPKILKENTKSALSVFGSTSPSYIILQSLDSANTKLSEYGNALPDFIRSVDNLKSKLKAHGYVLYGNEPMKITLAAKEYGYTGHEMNGLLKDSGIVCEFCDPDYLVIMPSPDNTEKGLSKLWNVLSNIPKKSRIEISPPMPKKTRAAMSPREAVLSPCETVAVKDAVGRISGNVSVSCPPAVPIAVSGEIIDSQTVKLFEYYGIETCIVVK